MSLAAPIIEEGVMRENSSGEVSFEEEVKEEEYPHERLISEGKRSRKRSNEEEKDVSLFEGEGYATMETFD